MTASDVSGVDLRLVLIELESGEDVVVLAFREDVGKYDGRVGWFGDFDDRLGQFLGSFGVSPVRRRVALFLASY